MSKFDEFKKKALNNPEVKKEYQALESEFKLIDQLLSMRTASGLTQAQIAEKMGTKKSNISRLENGKGNPSWLTMTSYAIACGFTLELIPKKIQDEKRN